MWTDTLVSVCSRIGKVWVSLAECVRPCGVERLNLWNLFECSGVGALAAWNHGQRQAKPGVPLSPLPPGALWVAASPRLRQDWEGWGSGLEGQLSLCQGTFNLAGCCRKGQSGERHCIPSSPQLRL